MLVVPQELTFLRFPPDWHVNQPDEVIVTSLHKLLSSFETKLFVATVSTITNWFDELYEVHRLLAKIGDFRTSWKRSPTIL